MGWCPQIQTYLYKKWPSISVTFRNSPISHVCCTIPNMTPGGGVLPCKTWLFEKKVINFPFVPTFPCPQYLYNDQTNSKQTYRPPILTLKQQETKYMKTILAQYTLKLICIKPKIYFHVYLQVFRISGVPVRRYVPHTERSNQKLPQKIMSQRSCRLSGAYFLLLLLRNLEVRKHCCD
jgi:hypothetical protein